MAVEMGTPSVVAGAAFDRNLTAGSAANPLKVSRGDRIRTCDLVLPKHPRYQAAPRPVPFELYWSAWHHWIPELAMGLLVVTQESKDPLCLALSRQIQYVLGAFWARICLQFSA